MKRSTRIFATLGITIGAAVLAAASFQPGAAPAPTSPPAGAMPVVAVQQINTDSAETYAKRIGEANKMVKEKLGLENYVHVFVGEAAGPDSGVAFAVSRAESFAALAANRAKFESDSSLMEANRQLGEIRKLGPLVVYKAVRWDGGSPGACVMNVRSMVTDEAGYLRSLDGLRALLDTHAFKDIKINCYRAVAGRTEFSHFASINCPSRERRAAVMDALASEPWALEWIAGAAKYRTVVSNGTYRELTN